MVRVRTRPLRILIADDHPAFRRAARLLLARRGFAVIGEAGCARTALEAATALEPDGVLLDLHLGDACGCDVALVLTRREPAPAVLLVSSEPPDASPERLRTCGARGFVLKSDLVRADLASFWGD